MYKIKIDSDKLTLLNRIVSAKSLIELVGDEPLDCVLASDNNIVFYGDVDLSKYKKFKTIHPDFISKDWNVIN